MFHQSRWLLVALQFQTITSYHLMQSYCNVIIRMTDECYTKALKTCFVLLPLLWHRYLFFSESQWWGRLPLNPSMLAASDWMDCTKPTKQCCDPPLELSLWNSILDSLHRLSVSRGYNLSRNEHTHTHTHKHTHKASHQTICRQPSNKSGLILGESVFLQCRHNKCSLILSLPVFHMTSAVSGPPVDPTRCMHAGEHSVICLLTHTHTPVYISLPFPLNFAAV